MFEMNRANGATLDSRHARRRTCAPLRYDRNDRSGASGVSDAEARLAPRPYSELQPVSATMPLATQRPLKARFSTSPGTAHIADTPAGQASIRPAFTNISASKSAPAPLRSTPRSTNRASSVDACRGEIGLDHLAENLAQLDAPLIERIDVPHRRLHQHLVLVQRDQRAERTRSERIEKQRAGRTVAREHESAARVPACPDPRPFSLLRACGRASALRFARSSWRSSFAMMARRADARASAPQRSRSGRWSDLDAASGRTHAGRSCPARPTLPAEVG